MDAKRALDNSLGPPKCKVRVNFQGKRKKNACKQDPEKNLLPLKPVFTEFREETEFSEAAESFYVHGFP